MRSIRLLILAIIFLALPCIGFGQINIAPLGKTEFTAKIKKIAVLVEIDSASDTGRERSASNDPSQRVVRAMKIAVHGQSIFVPRSAYADLVDPRIATVKAEQGAWVLIIEGGDGADSYFVKINFDAQRVTRRKLYSSLIGGAPTEDTKYWLRVLKDE